MKLRAFVAMAAAMLLAAPALADVKGYSLEGDSSTLFPTDMTILRAGSQHGKALLKDTMSGTPTLLVFETHNEFIDTVGGTTTTNIPGTTVTLDNLTWTSVPGGQTGSGDTWSTINWGSLTGWTQTGRLVCETHCPGGCGAASSCVPFVGFEGTGPPGPLNGSVFNTDPWIFTDHTSFTAPSVEFVNLGAGAVRGYAQSNGTLAGFADVVPTFGIGGLAALGAALFYLGARAIRGRQD